jgi:hypothetical protein
MEMLSAGPLLFADVFLPANTSAFCSYILFFVILLVSIDDSVPADVFASVNVFTLHSCFPLMTCFPLRSLVDCS